jgi:hypothetical protein
MTNGVYNARPWVAPPQAAYPPQAYIGPFPSNQDRMMTQAMGVISMTPSDIQEYVRPNLPQVNMFPEKFGYFKGAVGIEDVIQLTSRTYERTDFSGASSEINSTSRNNLGMTI